MSSLEQKLEPEVDALFRAMCPDVGQAELVWLSTVRPNPKEKAGATFLGRLHATVLVRWPKDMLWLDKDNIDKLELVVYSQELKNNKWLVHTAGTAHVKITESLLLAYWQTCTHQIIQRHAPMHPEEYPRLFFNTCTWKHELKHLPDLMPEDHKGYRAIVVPHVVPVWLAWTPSAPPAAPLPRRLPLPAAAPEKPPRYPPLPLVET